LRRTVGLVRESHVGQQASPPALGGQTLFKDPAQWFHQDRLPWIDVVNTSCLVAVLLPKYIVSRDIQAGPLLDFIHVPLHLLIPTGRPKHDKEMMNTGG
jgi:hypothetical protein